jgi:hypothetical protein
LSRTTHERRENHEVASKRSRDEERAMNKLIDELWGCLTEGDALRELERDYRAEILADERRRP